ncbi:MAG: hypothetical protein GXO07_06120 [Crenarchaeota archaeon]|nr:hypothetical protein [Thermoproteota archaeon]
MKAYWLSIKLETPALADTEQWGSLYTPSSKTLPGSTIAGALRRRFGKLFKASDAFPKGSLPAPPGSLKLKDVERGDRYFLPLPQLLGDLMAEAEKVEPEDELAGAIEGEAGELLRAKYGGLTKRLRGEPLEVTSRTVGRFLEGRKAKVEFEERTSVSISLYFRTARPGMLFHQTVFAEGQEFWALVIGELPEREFVLRIGAAKTRGLGKVKVTAEEIDVQPGTFLLSRVPVAFVRDRAKGLLVIGKLTLWRNGLKYSVNALMPGSVLEKPLDCPWCVAVDYGWLLSKLKESVLSSTHSGGGLK